MGYGALVRLLGGRVLLALLLMPLSALTALLKLSLVRGCRLWRRGWWLRLLRRLTLRLLRCAAAVRHFFKHALALRRYIFH